VAFITLEAEKILYGPRGPTASAHCTNTEFLSAHGSTESIQNK